MVARNTGRKTDNKDNLGVLKEQLKNKTPANLYLFTGEEPFLIDYYVGELKRIVIGDDVTGLNLSMFENRFDIDDLLDACDTYPIMKEKRLVIVKDSGLFSGTGKKNEGTDEFGALKKEAPKGNKAQESLLNYIPDMPETTCLIFIESKIDKRLKLYKLLSKYGLVLEFNRVKEPDLARWVIKGMEAAGKKINSEAAQYLVAISENDMYTLRNEIYKLAAYVDPKTVVTVDDVKLIAIPTIKSVIFDLLDAVAKKDTQRALILLNDMLLLKEPEQKIMSMLSKQTGELLKLRMLIDGRASQSEINEVFRGRHPYAMKIMVQQASRMKTGYLKKFVEACMEAEMNYKRGMMTPKLALELLLEKTNSIN